MPAAFSASFMTQFAKETLPISLEEEMRRSYLDYAMSVIVGRALPDARDGLKPVHRRILHAMRLLRLDPGTAFKKCATSSATSSASSIPMVTKRSMMRWCVWHRRCE